MNFRFDQSEFPYTIVQGAWPSIELPDRIATSIIIGVVENIKLPRLKALARKYLPSKDKLALFKMILQKRYDIPSEELDSIETQTNILWK